MVQPARVLIADDSARARAGLRALLATLPGVTVIGEATDGRDAVLQVAAARPDIVLMDLHMPVLNGMEAIKLIQQQWPAVMVIVLSMYSVEQSAALAAGADAFLSKGGDPQLLLSMLSLGVETDKFRG